MSLVHTVRSVIEKHEPSLWYFAHKKAQIGMYSKKRAGRLTFNHLFLIYFLSPWQRLWPLGYCAPSKKDKNLRRTCEEESCSLAAKLKINYLAANLELNERIGGKIMVTRTNLGIKFLSSNGFSVPLDTSSLSRKQRKEWEFETVAWNSLVCYLLPTRLFK